MSKTKKKLFYSAIVAAVILLAFVAVTFMTSMIDDTSVIAESGEGADAVSTKTVNPSNDSDYNALNVRTDMTYPGTFTGMTQQGSPISDAAGLDAALKTNGTYYLTKNISYEASTSSSSAASRGTFGGVIYGNGYTVTVTVTGGSYSWTTDGSYGFLVKNLSGTIRDLNVVIVADESNWTKFGFNTSGSGTVSQVDGESAYMQNIGGIAGNMTGGLIHNCSVKYTGYLWLITNGADPAAGNAWSGDNMANIFGGVAGRASGGIISYTTVDFTGRVVNAGQQRGDGTNHLMISTGGVVGQVGNGTVYMRKITVQGGGWIASEAHTYSRGTFNYPYSDVLTGGIAGWVSSAANANLQVNGVYLNLTYFSQGADTGAYNGVTASNGNGGAVKSYYASTGGINKNAFKSAADSIANDQAGNISSDAYASEMRTSYGIGAVHQSKTNSVSLNNVYVSSATADIIQKHHPYAAHQIYYGRDTSNTYWNRWNWVYTVVDTATLGTEFAFAPTTSVGNTVNHNTADILNLTNSQRGVYFKVSNQSASRFVYNIKQGTDSVNDLYQIYSKTYNNFGNGGTLWVPAMFAGYTSTVKSEVRGYNTLTDTNSSTVTTYKNTVSAEFGSYLYMDFEMTRSYEGTDRYSDGYTGSGDSYTYTYNGDMLYVPAFAGYKTSYGTGDKVSFTEDELNSIGMSSTNFSLSSSYTITSSQSVNYDHYQWLHWNGAGNVGTYTMNYSVSDTLPKFITKDGNYYYCAFKAEYSPKTVSVVPRELTLNWNTGDMVYDGTGKDVSTAFTGLPSGTSLGNNDGSNLGVTISYSADNENLLIQNKPYHAGDYTATATLTYGGTTENVYTGNFTLANSSQPFTVSKVQMTLNPSTVTSKYGDNHTEALATASVGVEGNWVGDDASYFDFVVKTVDDTINFATVKGSYPTTVEATLKENATAELLTDYEFSVNQGALVINERPINGVLTINNGVYNGSEYVATLTLDEGVRVSTDKVYDLGYVQDSVDTATAVNAGEYLVRITPEANKYTIGNILIQGKDELYAYGETKLVIEQRSVDVTLSFDNGFVYDGKDKVTGYVAQMQEGNAGVIEGEDAGLTMYYNGETQAVMPAVYTATAAFSNPNYKAGTVIGGTFTVEKAELVQIRIDMAEAVFDGTEKSIGYTLVGVTDEENIASLAGNVTITYNKAVSQPVNAGVYDVEISVAEGVAYKAAETTATFTVNKAQIEFVPVTSTVYTGREIDPEYAINAPGMTDASSLKGYVTEQHSVIDNANNYDVKLVFAGTNNYEAQEYGYTLVVNKADLVLTADEGQALVYNREDQLPVYSIAALYDGDVYGEVTVSVSGDNVVDGKAIAAGSYTMTVSVAQSVNYNAASVTVGFTIGKYALDLIGATEQFVTVISDDGVTEVTEINRYIPSMDVALIDDTGVYTNDSLRYVTRVNGEEASNLVFSDGKAVFTADVTVDGLDTENYTFAGATITVNVLDASITITVNGNETAKTSVTFGDALEITAKGSYGGSEPAEFDNVTWYGEDGGALGGQPSDAGIYTAVFRYTFDADSNYVERTLYLTIAPKAVTVTLNGSGVGIVYGDEITQDSFEGATYASTDTSDPGLTIEYSTNAQRFSPVGEYSLGGTVIAVADGKKDNYEFTVVPGTLRVNAREVFIKADDVSAVYGDEILFSNYKVYENPEAIAEWSGYADAAQIKVSFSVQNEGVLTVGSYEISVTGDNPNYIVGATTDKGALVIGKRNVTIAVADVSVVYGSTELPQFRSSIVSGSLVNGDVLGAVEGTYIGSVALDRLTVNPDGYALQDYVKFSQTITSAQQGINYEIAFADTSKLSVNPKKIEIVFAGWQSDGALGVEGTATYNASAWTPSVTIKGVINEDDVDLTYDPSEVRNVGKYSKEITLAGADALNYTADACIADLEILPYKTEITVDSAEYVYTYKDEKTDVNSSVVLLDGDDAFTGEIVQKNYVGTNTTVTGTRVDWNDVWDAGVYTVVVEITGGNYTADPVTVSVTVNKMKIAKVDAYNGGDLGTSEYSATNVSLNADDIADVSVYDEISEYIFVSFSLNGNSVTVIRNAGEYSVDIRLVENTNYEVEGEGDSLLNAPARYTVTKANSSVLQFALSYTNKVYTGEDMTEYVKSIVTVLGLNGEPVTGATLTISATDELSAPVETIVDSGVYEINVLATDMTNYNDMQSSKNAGAFTVDKVYVIVNSITLDDAAVTYNAQEQSVTGNGISDSVVLKDVGYRYLSEGNLVSETGVTAAGVYDVEMIVHFDAKNTRLSEESGIQTVPGENGDLYELVLRAQFTVNRAVPVLTTDTDTLSSYFDGYNHAIAFTLNGVGDEALTYTFDYNAEKGVADEFAIEGLGRFTVRYYTDAGYGNMLVDDQSQPVLPITVLENNGRTSAYYMLVSFVSDNPNYSDAEYRNTKYEYALFIMPSVVTLTFKSLSARYGELATREDANEFIGSNMSYTYTIAGVSSASLVNYDPEAMLDIGYNINVNMFDGSVGTYDIAVSANAIKTEFAGSVSAVIRNASAIKLEVLPANVTDTMTSVFKDVKDTFGQKTYTQDDFNVVVRGLLNESVPYIVSYEGNTEFAIADAGVYNIDVAIPAGNYNAWNGTVVLSIDKKGVDVVWTMGGEAPVEGVFTKTYDGRIPDIVIEVTDAQGVTANCVYVNAEGAEINAPYAVGTYTAKAVLSDNNYFVNSDSETVTVVIEAQLVDEETIKGWIKDDSDVYGSVQGIDITGLPDGYGATSIVYQGADASYDMTTIKNATVGEYSATVTVSNGSSSGSATFIYTVTRRPVTFTVNASVDYGVKLTAKNLSLSANSTLASGDTASVAGLQLKANYTQQLAFGIYDLGDYVQSVTVTFNRNADCYDYKILMGTLTIAPDKAPEVESVTANYNTATVRFTQEGLYAYRVGIRGEWKSMSAESDTLIVPGLSAQTAYTIYIAYAGFTSVNSSQRVTTTADPGVLSTMIDEIREGGLTLDKKDEYDAIVEYYENIAESDRSLIQAEYDALVAQFNALDGNNTGGGDVNGAVIAICVTCLVLVIASVAAVVVAAVYKKRKKAKAFEVDDKLV